MIAGILIAILLAIIVAIGGDGGRGPTL